MSSTQGSHSLAFRVMRLCRPSFHVDNPLLIDPLDLLTGEDLFDDPIAATQLPRLFPHHLTKPNETDLSYRHRFQLHNPSDSMGLSGLLVLPQAFGAIYLGETFCSYISINNSSNFEVRDVSIKAEIQTEKQRILLLDTSKSPVESIRSGGRYDFIVEHDVKELGAHTLVCTALYNDGDGERKYLPQFFKFIVANPLSVRTKVRSVKHISRKEIGLQIVDIPSITLLQQPFLVRLTLTNQMDRKMGPFQVCLSERDLQEEKAIMVNGLQTLVIPQVEALSSTDLNLVRFDTSDVHLLNQLRVGFSTQLHHILVNNRHQVVESLIATRVGVQKITGITLLDKGEKKTYDPLPDLEIFVGLE